MILLLGDVMANQATHFASRLGKRIRELREKAALTQERAAEAAGITGKYWGEVERGSVAVSAYVLLHMADALGVGVADLMETEHLASRQEVLATLHAGLEQADDKTLRLYLRLLLALIR